MSGKFFTDIDAAFKDHFELVTIPEFWDTNPPSWTPEKVENVEVPSLKSQWVMNKFKEAGVDGSPQELINFFRSLPYRFQLHVPENYLDHIALLRERYLFAYLLEKREADSIFTHAARDTEFHDFYSSNDPITQLDNEIIAGLRDLRLKHIINKQYHPEDVYFEPSFLAACFNFFLFTLFAKCGAKDVVNPSALANVKKAKQFFFECFVVGVKDQRLDDFRTFLDGYLKKHKGALNQYLGFKKFRSYDPYFYFKHGDEALPSPWRYEASINEFYQEGNLYCRPEPFFDVYPVFEFFDASSRVNKPPLSDVVAVTNMIGSSKVISKYRGIMASADVDYLRYEKPYFGEPTFIKLQEKVISERDFAYHECDVWTAAALSFRLVVK